MSRPDDDQDRALEELLQLSEKEEAEALRGELMAFLRSPECAAELERIVRKPLEDVVLTALLNQKFQEQLRAKVLESLGPAVSAAAQTAANDAVARVTVSVNSKIQDGLQTKAQDVLQKAFEAAQKHALASFTIPESAQKKLREQVEKAVSDAVDNPTRHLPKEWTKSITDTIERDIGAALNKIDISKAAGEAPGIDQPVTTVEMAAAPTSEQPAAESVPWWKRPVPRLPKRSSKPLIVVLASVLFASFLGTWYLNRDFSSSTTTTGTQSGTAVASDTTATQPATSTTASTTTSPSPESPLSRTYVEALSGERLKGLPAATEEQLQCVKGAVRMGEKPSLPPDFAALSAFLNGCVPMQSRPAQTGSRFVAAVQEQINAEVEAKTCEKLGAVTADGRPGRRTLAALKTFDDCKDPIGVPMQAERLSDYTAVGIYFVHRQLTGRPK